MRQLFTQICSNSTTAKRKWERPCYFRDAIVRVRTFDQAATLVDWELDMGGRYMGASQIAEFENNLAATCQPCEPKVVETEEKDK